MVNLFFNVKGQHLTKVSEDFLANRSMNVLVLNVLFDSQWDGFTKYGIFANSTQKQINNAIDEKLNEIVTMIGECEDLIGGDD